MCVNGNLSYYFQKWKNNIDHLTLKQKTMKNCVNHMCWMNLDYCFRKWKTTLSKDKFEFYEETILEESKQIENLENMRILSRKNNQDCMQKT